MILREATLPSTPCCELITVWPLFVRIKDASKHGMGRVVIGKNLGCTPTIFCVAWPEDIQQALISLANPQGSLTNSELEMASLLLL